MAPLIGIQAGTKTFGVRPLFKDLSFVIEQGERVALIGANGSGKSTLLKVLAGVESLDDGQVTGRQGLRLAYVAQRDEFKAGTTIEEILFDALPDHAHDPHARISVIAGRAGFHDRTIRVDTLSGGWKKRLSIVRALVQEPELLLLDEPTNHLDIETILWLEDVIAKGNFAALFVTHDRYLIERAAQRVIELDFRYPRGFLSSSGHYSDFLETRSAYFEQLESYQASLGNRVRREVEWLRKGAKARTTKAQGRIQQAQALIAEFEALDIEERRVRLEFAASNRKTKELIKAEGIAKALGGKQLFSRLDLVLRPGLRLGIAGSNGSGKTTLLSVLCGLLPADKGTVWCAPKLRISRFDQGRQQLDLTQTLTQALCSEGDAVVFNGVQMHVSGWARRFLFRDEQLRLPVGKLSGGEQARVLIARVLIEPADVLILDEPTNDLDIATLEVLEQALREFPGVVMLVTHDRYLLDRVCTQVVGLHGDGISTVYAGYTQYEVARGAQSARQSDARTERKPDGEGAVRGTNDAPSKLTYAERIELDRMEALILKEEARLKSLEERVGSAPEPAELTRACEDLHACQSLIERHYQRWSELEQKQKEYDARRASQKS